jgi:hypothetical protein
MPFRTGTGEIIDADDRKSGQCDIVVEYANTLSFPNMYPTSARLYRAESVCAVVEVKSDLRAQWKKVLGLGSKLFKLKRKPGPVLRLRPPPPRIPLLAVGYTGWQSPSTALEKIAAAKEEGTVVRGVLQIEPSFFVGVVEKNGSHWKYVTYEGAKGIYGSCWISRL